MKTKNQLINKVKQRLCGKYNMSQRDLDIVRKSVDELLIVINYTELLTDEEIYDKACEYARNVKYPLNITNIKLRQAFKNRAMLIKNNLLKTK